MNEDSMVKSDIIETSIHICEKLEHFVGLFMIIDHEYSNMYSASERTTLCS